MNPLPDYVPFSKRRRNSKGHIMGTAREAMLIADWRANVLPYLEIRGLRESVTGFVGTRMRQIKERLAALKIEKREIVAKLREDWGKFDAERAAKVFHYNKPEGSDAQMRTEHAGLRKTYIHGFASAAHARDFARHMDNQSGIHSRPWKDANGYHVQVTHGARASQAESSWSSPSIEVEVLADHGREHLRERMRPAYPSATLSAEVAAGALGVRDLKEAVALSSHTQLTRPHQGAAEVRRMHDNEKGTAPKTPFEQMTDEQTAINSKDPTVRRNLLAMGAARRRQAYATSVAQQSHEGEKGMSMLDDDTANVGGRSAYTYTGQPDDDLRVDDAQSRAARAIQDNEDEEEDERQQEDHGEEGPVRALLVKIGDLLKGEGDPDIRKALSTAAASLSRIVGEDEEEAVDHGSHTSPTYAAEDGEEEVYNSEGEAWEDGDGPKFYMNAEGELEQVEDEEETHGGGTGSGVPEPPAPGERYGTLRQPAGQSGVGAIEFEDGEVPRKPGSSPMPGRGGLKRYPGEPQAKREAAAEVLESLRPFSNEYHTGVR